MVGSAEIEILMEQIKPHLKEDKDGHHDHYNSVYVFATEWARLYMKFLQDKCDMAEAQMVSMQQLMEQMRKGMVKR